MTSRFAKRTELLLQKQSEQESVQLLQMVEDIPIRWNSTYNMILQAMRLCFPLLCVQLYNNIYPFPLSQVVPLSQTDPATDPYRNTKRSDQPDRGVQPAHTNQTPARWAAREHQTETGITGRDGRSGPHRISQPIGGHPRNPPVRDRTTGGNWDETVKGNRGNAGRTGIYTEDRGTFYSREIFYSMY